MSSQRAATLQGNASLKWWRAMMAGDGWVSLWICLLQNDDWAQGNTSLKWRGAMMAGDGWVGGLHFGSALLQMMTGHSINATSLVLGYGSISQLLAGDALPLQNC
ncbi:unnamed protein product [Sphagnum jensenii]|uniref:Uncharacterized protein n=1 Tax=Sphagnum jensenii TaxID=128206 RepID=A0ABP0XKI8_9BRYO